jgi:hypothetical protein
MATTRIVDLNDFWNGNVELANFAGQLLTDREQAADSIFAGDPYGSVLSELLRSPVAPVLVPAEIQRVIDVVGIDAELVSVEQNRAELSALEASLLLTPSALRT